MAEGNVKPGLEGVVAGETSICAVRPQEGKLIYRGYDIHVLAEEVSFEEVAYLLLYQRLPTKSELKTFDQQLKAHRELPPGFLETLRSLPSHGPAMDHLRAAASILGLYDPDLENDSPEANLRKSIRLLGQLTTIVAAQQRISQGLKVVSPNPNLNHAANFLYMLRGKSPEELEVRVLDITFTLYAEHEFNASTFTARVVASTLSDLHGAVTGALASLKGPLHGGANEKAMEVLLEIGDPSRAEAWVLNALKEKKRIMGFGHRIYKKADSRVELAKKWGKKLAEKEKNTKWHEICEIVENVMRREKNLFPNVDFYSAPIYNLMGIPINLYTPLFACSRVVGWSAHVMEQKQKNRLFRPNSLYIGPEALQFRPIEKRRSP
ncbi:MAG: citrate/2-methylcitrate synthase [Candidatus Binatia bacterium]